MGTQYVVALLKLGWLMNNKSKTLPWHVGVSLICSRLYFCIISNSLSQCVLSLARGKEQPLSHSMSPRLKSPPRNVFILQYGLRLCTLLRDKINPVHQGFPTVLWVPYNSFSLKFVLDLRF